MRRTIRLTGRKQLPISCINVHVRDVGEGRVVTLDIVDHQKFSGFPKDARLTLRLTENKQMELVDFGTIGSPKLMTDLQNTALGDPSCQLRVASTNADHLGLLLGSTKNWRLNSDRQASGNVRGILRFQPMPIAPRAWKLDIQESAHPVVQIDDRIPDPRNWVRTDPVFIAAVLPSILQLVFEDILSKPSPADIEWMNDWIRWADSLMPGYPPPTVADDFNERRDWIERMVDSFCLRHNLSDRIIDDLEREVAA